jgi:N-acetylglucosamine malate deacetylase 2
VSGQSLLFSLATDGQVSGRHVVVTAHADDETISFGGALSVLTDVAILQLTTGSASTDPDVISARRAERCAAFAAAGWTWPVWDVDVPGRAAHTVLAALVQAVRSAIVDADVVWTHPYEGGHLDHDSAAYLVQEACARTSPAPLRMEFASYHATDAKRSTFGAFWPDPTVDAIAVPLTGSRLARKRAALAAYSSQAHILRKFPTLDVEHYRVAPTYDFTKPPAPPSRWDLKGYTPTTADWRAAVAEASIEVRQ